jgi:hypothetical protein
MVIESGEVTHLFQARQPRARNSRLGSPAEGGGKEPLPKKGGGWARARELENGLRELERALVDRLGSRFELPEQRSDVDSPVGRGIGRQAAPRLLELALAADPVVPPGLVPGDGDVYEALKEIALRRFRCAPCGLQLLVGSEELAAADQLEAALERVSQGSCPATPT